MFLCQKQPPRKGNYFLKNDDPEISLETTIKQKTGGENTKTLGDDT